VTRDWRRDRPGDGDEHSDDANVAWPGKRSLIEGPADRHVDPGKRSLTQSIPGPRGDAGQRMPADSRTQNTRAAGTSSSSPDLHTTQPKPTVPDELPGGAKFDSAKWTKSVHPKTTFDDPGPFLAEAEQAWISWQAKQNATPAAARTITMLSPGGVVFGGYLRSLRPPWHLTTIFVEKSWF